MSAKKYVVIWKKKLQKTTLFDYLPVRNGD